MRTDATHALQKAIQDGLYITIGLGVLTAQRVQDGSEELARVAAERFEELDARFGAFETRVAAAIDDLESRLPEPARQLVSQARDTADQARTQLRELATTAN